MLGPFFRYRYYSKMWLIFFYSIQFIYKLYFLQKNIRELINKKRIVQKKVRPKKPKPKKLVSALPQVGPRPNLGGPSCIKNPQTLIHDTAESLVSQFSCTGFCACLKILTLLKNTFSLFVCLIFACIKRFGLGFNPSLRLTKLVIVWVMAVPW